MKFQRIGYFSILALTLCAAATLGWHSLAVVPVVHAQQSSSAAAPAGPPPSQEAQQPAPANQSAPAPAQQQQPDSSAAPQQQSSAPAAAPAPQQAPPADNPHAIKAETNEVRVDVVVTDKKGNYITDLTQKDFKVYEDNKEQPVNSFSFGADPNAPVKSQRHYLVLFFDTTSMDLSDQPRARGAAAKFIEAHAGPDQVMSVMNFGGSLQIVQNFTTDADRLAKAVSGIYSPNVSSNPNSRDVNADELNTLGVPNTLQNSEASFSTYTLLLAIRNLAKNLAAIPGRKSLILFTAGFPLDSEVTSELTATIDACNKANVAVYPLDVRGLIAPVPSIGGQLFENGAPDTNAPAVATARGEESSASQFTYATFHPSRASSSSYLSDFGVPADLPGADSAVQPTTLPIAASLLPIAFQHGGGGGGGGGGHGGGGGTGGGGTGGGGTGGGGGKGGTGGGTGGTGGKGGTGGTGGTGGKGGTGGGGAPRGGLVNLSPYAQAHNIVPAFPESASTNQQVLYELASGTGGFTILNTNDLLPGLEKISREQDHYYLLGYTPGESKEGSCHTLRVKVERGGTNVRARSGFCNIPPTNPLKGKPVEKDLEMRAAAAVAPANTSAAVANAPTGAATGAAPAAGSIQAPYFYTAANQAQVHVAMDVPPSTVNFEKVKGKYHADVNVLGIAYKPDGSVASRFSDQITLDLEKPEWEAFMKEPMHYENQFAIVPGTYKLSVAMGGGADKFGTYQTPLVVDAYDGKKLTVSSMFISKQLTPTTDDGGIMEADLLADRTPFVVHHVQLTPSAGDHFKKTDKFVLYAQVYAPQLAQPNPPKVLVSFVVVDPKTGKGITGATKLDMASFIQKGSPVIPVALKVPLDGVQPGEYKLQFQANVEGGGYSQIRTLPFVLEEK